MSMTDICLTWFNRIEKGIWGENICSNRYFTTCALLFILLMGSILGCRETIQMFTGYNLEINGVSLAALGTYIAGILVCESIFIAEKTEIAILRTLLAVTCALLMFVAGYLSALVGIAVTAFFCIVALAAIIRQFKHKRSRHHLER
ncbi:MAG: hypothetical protein IKL75_05570 [Bacteroidaceae bacterium]|nr:hypothetical protein [Bacteroidaceae bacterium]